MKLSLFAVLAFVLFGLTACDGGGGLLPTEPPPPAGIARLQVYLQQDCQPCGLVDVSVDGVHAGTIQAGEFVMHDVVPGNRNVVARGAQCNWAGTTDVGSFGQLYSLCCGGCEDGDGP